MADATPARRPNALSAVISICESALASTPPASETVSELRADNVAGQLSAALQRAASDELQATRSFLVSVAAERADLDQAGKRKSGRSVRREYVENLLDTLRVDYVTQTPSEGAHICPNRVYACVCVCVCVCVLHVCVRLCWCFAFSHVAAAAPS